MKRKRNWRRILLWGAGVAVVLLIAGLFAVNTAVDYVLNMMADNIVDDLMLGADAEPFVRREAEDSKDKDNSEQKAYASGDNGLQHTAVPQQPIDSSNRSGNGDASGSGSTGAAKPPQSGGSSTGATKPPSGQPTQQAEGTPGTASPSQTEGAASQAAGTEANLSYSAEISAEKAELVQKEITLREKAKVTGVLMSNFSADDLRLFMQMAQGGLSIEEKREAKKIFMEKLSEDEYDALIAIAAKYGLSRGETYAETTKPE